MFGHKLSGNVKVCKVSEKAKTRKASLQNVFLHLSSVLSAMKSYLRCIRKLFILTVKSHTIDLPRSWYVR